MSGQKLMSVDGAATEEWIVRDPIGESEEVYVEVREEIERMVMALILRLRNTARRIGLAN
jgi:protein-tyrosine-phosphatase